MKKIVYIIPNDLYSYSANRKIIEKIFKNRGYDVGVLISGSDYRNKKFAYPGENGGTKG